MRQSKYRLGPVNSKSFIGQVFFKLSEISNYNINLLLYPLMFDEVISILGEKNFKLGDKFELEIASN